MSTAYLVKITWFPLFIILMFTAWKPKPVEATQWEKKEFRYLDNETEYIDFMCR